MISSGCLDCRTGEPHTSVTVLSVSARPFMMIPWLPCPATVAVLPAPILRVGTGPQKVARDEASETGVERDPRGVNGSRCGRW